MSVRSDWHMSHVGRWSHTRVEGPMIQCRDTPWSNVRTVHISEIYYQGSDGSLWSGDEDNGLQVPPQMMMTFLLFPMYMRAESSLPARGSEACSVSVGLGVCTMCMSCPCPPTPSIIKGELCTGHTSYSSQWGALLGRLKDEQIITPSETEESDSALALLNGLIY